jgi:8-oxo-dGTP pyrophosphatase MutT (NUDIX family)
MPGGGFSVFMVRRHTLIEFMPDVFVFPGGSVHADDAALEAEPGRWQAEAGGTGAPGGRFRIAAVRECFEEAGVLLARRRSTGGDPVAEDAPAFERHRLALHNRGIGFAEIVQREDLVLSTDELIYWAHWITPVIYPKRFDTHFFLAGMPPRQVAGHDLLESTDSVWVTPQAALAASAQGTLPMADVTERQLRVLAGLTSVEDARRHFADNPPRVMLPRVEVRDGNEYILSWDDDATRQHQP